MAMTLKDEFLLLWIFCLVMISFAARHVLVDMVYLVEKLAAFGMAYMPGLLHLAINHWR